MGTHRWTGWAAGALLLGSAAATAVSTYLHWLPCRGSMLSGSILRGYAYGRDFSDACLRRMDGGPPFPFPPEPAAQEPWAAELGITAMALAALAWLLLLLGLRWPGRDTLVAALPGVVLLVMALVAGLAVGDPTRSPDASLPNWLWATLDATALVALLLVMLGQPGRRRRPVLVLAGVTAFGITQSMLGYAVMVSFSDANWDSPPGTGYLTAAVLLVSAVLTLALAGSAGQERQHRGVPLLRMADQDPVRTVLEDHQH